MIVICTFYTLLLIMDLAPPCSLGYFLGVHLSFCVILSKQGQSVS